MKAAKQITLSFGIALIFIFAVYTGLWFWMANNIKQQAIAFMAEAEEKDIQFITRTLVVKNFPLTPEVHFSGRVYSGGATLEVPLLKVRSLFITERPLTIEAPMGLSILEPADTDIWSLGRLEIETVIPVFIPETLTNEDLTAWRDQGGQILIDTIELEKGSLSLKGQGRLTLDQNLQPEGEFNAEITGHMAFLNWLQEKDYIETREALLAAAVLSGLSKTDPGTNESSMNVALMIQNQTLFLGPLRLAYLPAIQWGWRSAPVRPQ